ncbi:hypothetical protein OG462_42165 [Streptomyces sp. NBC_01077]|uniref:hypothetical protein n=1 Tax=Streptomyces sp. NBC_01077 TaxID=2903746 RepID=UPI00386E4A37|nr:hypothetical protein OG462_02855 [Streptomyces sp. NBC_01077]WSV43468.1 hypothetical protein OG462_42165 [Streptomyces sp. NBC_01077]
MPRSEPSKADQELIRQARAQGYAVSASQLERWRRRGLLPQPTRVYRGRHGTASVYPDGTSDLVCALARLSVPGRRSDDLALLAFFDGADVPETALKLAIARTYFNRCLRHENVIAQAAARVPEGWDSALGKEYEAAEAEARTELAKGGRAVRQMRINLRRLPDLAGAPQRQVDERLLGVLVGLNRLRLPEDDHEFMADLSAALAFDCSQDDDDVFAVWEYAAISHSSQMARYEETSPEERFDLLLETSREELCNLREEVRTAVDQMWHRATWGLESEADLSRPSMARNSAGMLMEWMSARQVQPGKVSMADRYFLSLGHLELCCLAAERSVGAAWQHPVGEGRARFIARTTWPRHGT